MTEPKMSDEFGKLSVPDLQALIERAHQEIERRKEAGRETLRAEIEAQLINSGLELTDLFPEAVRGVARARKTKAKEDGKATVPKYKDHASGETWSGRGPRPPQWVRSVMSQRGWTLEQFRRATEFLTQS